MKVMPRRLGTFALEVVLLVHPGAAIGQPVLAISPAQTEALGIEVVSARETTQVSRPPLPGRIFIPNDRALVLSTRTAGVVLELAVSIGDAVTEGQPVARLESPAFVTLQREFLESLSQRELARSTSERERQLADEGIVASRRAAESEARLREVRSLVDERRQALGLVGMDDAEIDELARTRRMRPTLAIRTPVSGFVLEQRAHVGERLEAGSALYRIGGLDVLHVEIHVPVETAGRVREGTPFTLAGRDAAGRVIAVGRDVHARDQGVLVRGELETGLADLRPGQFVRVHLQSETNVETAFEVPASAVVRVANAAFVFRRVPEGYEPLAVEVIGGAGRRAVITGPLSADDALVTRGTSALKAQWLGQGGPD